MAVGKNSKVSKKGGKKKVVDPFSRKEWYDVRAPAMFSERDVGKTLVNRTQGTRIASDFLKGRVYEVSLSDLNKGDIDYRKFRLVCEEVKGRNCLTNFHGMTFTRDKLCSIIKKWHVSSRFLLILTRVLHSFRPWSKLNTRSRLPMATFFACLSSDSRSVVRIKSKKTSYAQSSKVRQIRAKMVDIIQKEVSQADLREVVNKLIPDSIGKEIEKACSRYYPLSDVYIRKVKVVKKPRFDLAKLLELHGELSASGGTGNLAGAKAAHPDVYEPPIQESV
ncbi:40S ribosomal protein S3a [Aphelenchoides besseyi]|nr:40S ribosomal protein S3a [Aphelenchoides besseyi]